jgi:high-affinity K+ transport system ATPase subunit B
MLIPYRFLVLRFSATDSVVLSALVFLLTLLVLIIPLSLRQ